MSNNFGTTKYFFPLRLNNFLHRLNNLVPYNSFPFNNNTDIAYDVGSVTSKSVEAMRVDVARNLFDLDGSGVTIGVISDTYDNLGGAASDIANGDLPEGVRVLEDVDVSELGDPPELGSDEGRALIQTAYDVAPGADFLFHTATFSSEGYAEAINKLAEEGADIILSDVSRPEEPFFQDGIIAQAVNKVVSEDGVAYFAAAGNSGSRSYESAFNPSGESISGIEGELHDFDPGEGVDTLQKITIPSGTTLFLDFQWDSPYASVNPEQGSETDLDIYLLDSSGTEILASSANSNLGEDPIEVELGFFNGGESTEFNIAILNKSDLNPELIKYNVSGAGKEFAIEEYDTASSTIVGNANAEGAAAVGAAYYIDTPEFGTDPAEPRFFSSTGGTPILYDTEGNSLTPPRDRMQPSFVAPDGGNTTFFGVDLPEDEDDLPNFPGTSAAVAHAAGVAALIKQANPSLSPDEIYLIMEITALDMDDPNTSGFDRGFDRATGYGLIQADRALFLAATGFPNYDNLNDPADYMSQYSSFMDL
jgi:subtilisin family serine protease